MTDIQKRKQEPDRDVIGRAGGVYIPPFKLAKLTSKPTDPVSREAQKQSWEALRKSLNGLVNKVTIENIPNLVEELFRENLIRGRGLVARAILRAQLASPGFSHIYAALLSVLNSKLPEIGELVLKRVVLQFRRAYRRNDKIVLLACVKFIAHCVNQRIAHELLALQLFEVLLGDVTDDSIEVSCSFLKDCGQVLCDIASKGVFAVEERLRAILSEGEVTKKTQHVIEELLVAARGRYKDFPGVLPDLDLVEEDDQITHEVDLLDDQLQGEEMLNIFRSLPGDEFSVGERQWAQISAEVLGADSDEGEVDEARSDGDSEAEEEEEQVAGEITDYTEQELVNLRKTIYLCIMSSLNFEECVHKLLKLNIKPGAEKEVCTMLIDCASMVPTFQPFYALQSERLSRLRLTYQNCFAECFAKQYEFVHRLETNKLRNTAKFFGHLFRTDSLPWTALSLFDLTEETTSASSRIFIKTIFQELANNMGVPKLQERIKDPDYSPSLQGLFRRDSPKNVRFSINFFTAIGLGSLTDDLRDFLTEQSKTQASAPGSSSSESDSSESPSDSSSDSE